jgi:hypothetical protein
MGPAYPSNEGPDGHGTEEMDEYQHGDTSALTPFALAQKDVEKQKAA